MTSERGLQFIVYLLKCKDGFYIGCTDNLDDRMKRHIQGYITATRGRRPVKLVNAFYFADKYTAFNFEKYLKSGSGRSFIKKHFSMVEN